MIVYLGGPITGLTFDEATDWRETILERPDWDPEWGVLSPMRDKEQFRIDGPLPSTFDEDTDAMAQDLADMRAMDVGLWNFVGAEWASIGSCCEIGYSYSQGKPIISVVEGESVHDHMFINKMSTLVVSTLDDAITEIARRHHEMTVLRAA